MASRVRFLAIASILALGLPAACSSNQVSDPTPGTLAQPAAPQATAAAPKYRRQIQRMRGPDGKFLNPRPLPAAHTGAPVEQLIYFGGRVIGNPQIVAVNWSSAVNTTITSQLPGFYTNVLVSPYMDWLSEYDTIGVLGQDGSGGYNQRIGHGSFESQVTITPSNASTSLTDWDIEAELAAQLTAGNLPAPTKDANGNVNTLYMIDFPSSISITLYNAGMYAQSCLFFGAYHSAMEYNGMTVAYGVHPDCGFDFPTATSIHSHEMAEAITDVEIGLVDPDLAVGVTRPSAWYSFINGQDNGEIGDICESSGDGTVAGYNVQTLWSNTQGSCIVTAPTIICDGSNPPIPNCRPCTAADNGGECNGARPFCETDSTNAKFGQCVVCTQSSQCPAGHPVCQKSSGQDDDSCINTAGCLCNSDCSGTTPICDSTTNQCRACLPSDCGGPTPACETLGPHEGQCVSCTLSQTEICGGQTPVCDPFKNTCVQCWRDSDCVGGAAMSCQLPTPHACTTGSAFDAGPGLDAGPVVDSGSNCGSDGGIAMDSGMDSGVVVMDSGTDSSTADSGVSGDASMPDASPPMDSGGPTDSGHATDAPPPMDSGVSRDGGRDASPPLDSGRLADSGALADGMGGEAGTGGTGDNGGCGCRTAPSKAPSNGRLAGLLLGLAFVARRRRRSGASV